MTLSFDKKLTALAVGFMALIATMLIFLISPSTSYAAPLGDESPHIYFTYEKNGVEIDGNNLLNDTYDVKIWLTGVEKVSTVQVTTTLDDTVTCAAEPLALMSDSVADMVSMGYVINDDTMVFGFVSDNTEYSVINPQATLIAEVSMTFAQAGDAKPHVLVSANPNLTFVQTSYNDDYRNSYAVLDGDFDYTSYDGTLYEMTRDESPELTSEGHSVSCSLVVMTNGDGATNGVPVSGQYEINVYADAEHTQLVKSVNSEEIIVDNNMINKFVIDGLADDTYYATISSEYAITREVVIEVNGADIEDIVIPMIVCNYNGDAGVTGADALVVYANVGRDDAPEYNLNGDAGVTGADALIIYALLGVDYITMTIS